MASSLRASGGGYAAGGEDEQQWEAGSCVGEHERVDRRREVIATDVTAPN